ncbi:hypothetical protein TNCT1_01690 [Streptomyces sp. 1-11]|nr:hypothetical protein TNCT1_01690 [Streptomyces sp. 1-11]
MTCDFFDRLVYLSAPGPQAAEHGVRDGPGAVFFPRPEENAAARSEGREPVALARAVSPAATSGIGGQSPRRDRTTNSTVSGPMIMPTIAHTTMTVTMLIKFPQGSASLRCQ